jgi:hypothetical protein
MLQRHAKDKRAQKTRHALLSAFFELVMERHHYDEITLRDILTAAREGKISGRLAVS